MVLNEIHELIFTDESSAAPGGVVDSCSAVAFFEIKSGGLIVEGDEVFLGEEFLGKLVGFDLTHMPNHMNLVVKTGDLKPKKIKIGERLIIKKSKI